MYILWAFLIGAVVMILAAVGKKLNDEFRGYPIKPLKPPTIEEYDGRDERGKFKGKKS